MFGILGCPETVLSHNGREFSNNIVNKLCFYYGVDQQFFALYHPSSISMVERNNSNIIRMLRTLIEENQGDRDTLLP